MTRQLECACASLRRAARAVTQQYDGALRAVGMRATQFTLLQALVRAGPLPQGELGELLAIDTTTLSRTLGLLERQGWVRARPGTDRRVRRWSVTAAGRRAYQRGVPHWERAQEQLRRTVGDNAFRYLLLATARVTDAVHAG